MAVFTTARLALPCSTAAKFTGAYNQSRLEFLNGPGISGFGGDFIVFGSSNSGHTTRSRGDGAIRGSRSWGNVEQFRKRNEEGKVGRVRDGGGLVVHALAANKEVVQSKGLAYDGPGRGGQWLSTTTRHVRIYIGVADPETQALDQSQLDKITLMLDPDNEFLWPEDKVQKVYDYFAELVEGYAGAPMTEYTLRLIGSDIEHYIRKLLLGNEIKYNMDCRVLNFSMGKPRYESGIIEAGED